MADSMKEHRCGYEFPPGDSADHSAYHQSCCIRPVWEDYDLRENDDSRRCVWHARTDETKPTSALNSSDVREDDDNRAVNLSIERPGEVTPGEVLDGAYLPEANLKEVDALDGCSIRRANMRDVYLSDETVQFGNLANSDLSEAWLRKADFTGTSLSQTRLTDTNLRGAKLQASSIQDAILERTNLLGANLRDLRARGAAVTDVSVDDDTEFRSPSQPATWLKVFPTKPKVPYDPRSDSCVVKAGKTSFQKAASVYNLFEGVARENSLPDLERQMYLQRQEAQRRHLVEQGWSFSRVAARVSREVYKYGESLSRVTLLAFATIVLSAVAYLLPYSGGIKSSATNTVYFDGSSSLLANFGVSLYFSTVTFSTVGFGNIHPAGDGAQLIAGIESLAGVFLSALLIFVLGRRTTR